jgi:hypothetical protein
MIELKKLDEPRSLQENKANWTKELLEAIASGDTDDIKAKKRRYNQPDVKAILKQETNDKCAYCESRVTVVAHGDIEHVTPKSIRPELTFEWGNLTFACQKCNGKKSNKEGLTDPYVDPIDDSFFFVGPFLKGRTEKGRLTEKELALNRAELIEDRSDQLRVLSDVLEKIANESNPRIKQLSLDALLDDLATLRPEYINMKRTVIGAFSAA